MEEKTMTKSDEIIRKLIPVMWEYLDPEDESDAVKFANDIITILDNRDVAEHVNSLMRSIER
jgi:hypothetical protein